MVADPNLVARWDVGRVKRGCLDLDARTFHDNICNSGSGSDVAAPNSVDSISFDSSFGGWFP